MYSSVTLASARLSLPREEGTCVGPREYRDLIRPSKAARGGTYLVPYSLRLREVRPDMAVLSAKPHAFRAASGLLHSDFCHLPVCSNQSPLKSRTPVTTHINHPLWILTLISLPLTPTTLVGPTIAPLPSSRPLSTKAVVCCLVTKFSGP